MTSAGRTVGRTAVVATRAVAVVLSSAVTGLLVGTAFHRLAGNRMAPWIVGRATGVFSYLAMVLLVLTGQMLSNPQRVGQRWLRTPALIRVHAVVAAITGAGLAVHIVVLATDRYAGVGWWGAVVPMGSQYRPASVTLGVAAAWLVALTGLSAAFAGRLPRRAWWPLHKIAAAIVVLAWTHGVFAGGDTAALFAMYVSTGLVLIMTSVWRYLARSSVEVLDT